MMQRHAIQVQSWRVILIEWLTYSKLRLAKWCLEATDNLPSFWAFHMVVALFFNGEDVNWLRDELALGPNCFGHLQDDDLHHYLFTTTVEVAKLRCRPVR